MIIKRKHAKNWASPVRPTAPAPSLAPVEHHGVTAPMVPPEADWDNVDPMPVVAAPVGDPYEEVSAEDFELGKIVDRRSNDRRQMFRRDGDVELISRAEEEANAIREKAAKEGFEEGLNQAREVTDRLNDAIDGLMNAREDAMAAAADELAALAIEIAERVIKTEVTCDEGLVMSLVRDTIAKVGREQRHVTVKVNPIELKSVKEAVKTDDEIPAETSVVVVEDASIEPGSCMVESRAGLIDARFGTQLEVLKRLVLTGNRGN